MLKIRVRLAYPSCGSPKHIHRRSICHQTWRNLAWLPNLEKLLVARRAQTPTETPTSTDTTEHKNPENERCFYKTFLITSWKKILTKLLENLWCFNCYHTNQFKQGSSLQQNRKYYNENT